MNLRRLFPILLLLLLASACTKNATVPADGVAHPISTNDDPDQRYTYAGLPESVDYPHPLSLLAYQGFITAYDEIRGNPAWVAYRVFAVPEYISTARPSRFLTDENTENRISHDDYTHSGYDRGHMAPNFAIVTRFGSEAQRETFLMTNIIPQRPALNRNWWATAERRIARDYSEMYDQVWVIIGPVYQETGGWIGETVKIPSHNFMIIMVEEEGKLKMMAFLVDQEISGGDPHAMYLVSVNQIEEKTGLNFNPFLEQAFADSIESLISPDLW
ncbi:MAG: DNA/RNA non-specific endonuclease [Balneolaceae bacterium]|nr:MAG: DNA/RNA non-specific endonuclease [Balneolaceae bacterium]